MDEISFACPWNLVVCVRGVPAHLNVGLIRKGKLPAIMPCNSKPNMNAFGITQCSGLFTSTATQTMQKRPHCFSSLSVLCSLIQACLCPTKQSTDGTDNFEGLGCAMTQKEYGFLWNKCGSWEPLDQMFYLEAVIAADAAGTCFKVTLDKRREPWCTQVSPLLQSLPLSQSLVHSAF